MYYTPTHPPTHTHTHTHTLTHKRTRAVSRTHTHSGKHTKCKNGNGGGGLTITLRNQVHYVLQITIPRHRDLTDDASDRDCDSDNGFEPILCISTQADNLHRTYQCSEASLEVSLLWPFRSLELIMGWVSQAISTHSTVCTISHTLLQIVCDVLSW